MATDKIRISYPTDFKPIAGQMNPVLLAVKSIYQRGGTIYVQPVNPSIKWIDTYKTQVRQAIGSGSGSLVFEPYIPDLWTFEDQKSSLWNKVWSWATETTGAIIEGTGDLIDKITEFAWKAIVAGFLAPLIPFKAVMIVWAKSKGYTPKSTKLVDVVNAWLKAYPSISSGSYTGGGSVDTTVIGEETIDGSGADLEDMTGSMEFSEGSESEKNELLAKAAKKIIGMVWEWIQGLQKKREEGAPMTETEKKVLQGVDVVEETALDAIEDELKSSSGDFLVENWKIIAIVLLILIFK